MEILQNTPGVNPGCFMYKNLSTPEERFLFESMRF